ncbi:MAG: translation initiation factor IF-2, partial [Eubacteriales bacterium]|nr:translation initiation factor IF-2 [Eubacteriales bacterium]
RDNNRTGGNGFRSRDGQNRTGDNNGRRFGQGRPTDGNNGGFRSRDGQNRTGDNNGRRFGQGRPADGNNGGFRSRDGQGRPGDGNNGGNRFNGQGRPDNRQGGMNKDNRFAGQGRPAGQRPAGRRPSADASFAPELTKTSKDSKRERDRENKNKKKDFDKTSQGGRRPNQNNMRPGQRLPKALQKPTPQPKQEEKKPEIKEITIPEKLTIRELADEMKMQPSVIVKKLFMQGEMVTVNSEIDFEKAEEIALEFDIIANKEEKVDVIGELLKDDEEEDPDSLVPRPPVVCVMGHVDHGKTSLLDAIRNTSVTRGEAGGITQHIGASVVSINGQKITFLDTPGHEAFTAMRMRGANSTDIAVLVVAADDGVMPQTVEAISHAKAAGVEIIVAVNKIDKPSANIDRVKQELSEHELVPDDWGGSTSFVPVSAKTGEGIDDLLEMILLTAEVSELKANPNRAVRGLVIEAQLDKGKGPVATILVQKGTLHVGDFIAAGACSGKVRAMMDDKGRRVKEAGPSTPVEILGLSDVPNAGEVLMSFDSDKEAKSFAGTFVSENKNRLLEETKAKLSLDNLFDQIHASDLKELPLIVKADVQGSVEAVKQSLTKLSNEEVVVRVIHGGVGAINESDVSLAATSNAIIIGFNVRPDATAKQLAEQEKVDLRLYKVIYQAIEDIESAMKGMLDPIFEEKVIGHAEIRQLFKASGIGTIAGSYILDGVFQRNCKVRITREKDQIFEGDLASLKRFKDDVKEVKAGYECGLVFDGFNDLKEEDKVEAYIMVEVPR